MLHSVSVLILAKFVVPNEHFGCTLEMNDTDTVLVILGYTLVQIQYL